MDVSAGEAVVWTTLVFTIGAATGAGICLWAISHVIKKVGIEEKKKKQEQEETEDWWKYGKTPPWVFDEEEN